MWERNERQPGERMKKGDVEYVKKENLFHIIKKCEATKNRMQIEEFMEEEEKESEIMKKIDRKGLEKKLRRRT